ncbi:transcriptional regulator [Paenibacillus spiritus]|uniref:Transcriptional regulator n=1 Tax=Paenibacillus spiritus TaxID=2496557 RepID=A0A5J5FZV2_9BACL|nr:metalloregulator ArsR/SmtB family transcription factor [Paenibacillus spiritus]KAA8999789.1 transcriptional regulator [Paenibacillus spiritus]
MKNAQESGSTRQMIMTLLKMKGPQPIAALAGQLGITEMGVRRHLLTLEREGLARTKVVRQAMGRPLHLYSLTDRADDYFPKNYHHLTLDLLRELELSSGREAVHGLFEGRRRRLLAQYAPTMERRTLEERVAELTRVQNAGGYMAEWSAGEDGTYEIREYNCPIRQVAVQYGKACQCEQHLFEELLDANLSRTECMAEGGHCCHYTIRPRTRTNPEQ